MTPGMSTSEFKLTFLNVLLSFAMLAYLVFTNHVLDYQALVTVLLGNITLSVGAYGIARGIAKGGATTTAVATTEPVVQG